MKVQCFTNLDLLPGAERWPEELPACPAVGDLIQSGTVWKRPDEGIKCNLELVVCQITWMHRIGDGFKNTPIDNWYPRIEMTVPSRFLNLRQFYEWYAKITGNSVSRFI